MDSKADNYLKRARQEIDSASILNDVSNLQELKVLFKLCTEATFYSGAISHSYYSIFYCAKAMLISKDITTKPPNIHKKTFEEFKKFFIDTGVLDARLLLIYKKMIVRADSLLEIYRHEKKKRATFTYNTIPQANKEPARESLDNALFFLKHCDAFLSNEPRVP